MVSSFNTLDGLENRAGSIFHASVHRHWLTHTAGRINSCPACLVWEADVIGIRKTVKERKIRKIRALAIGKVYCKIKGCGWHNAARQNHQIHIQVKIHAKQRIFAGYNHAVATIRNGCDIRPGHHYPEAILHFAVKSFQNTGDCHVFIDDKGLCGIVCSVTYNIGLP